MSFTWDKKITPDNLTKTKTLFFFDSTLLFSKVCSLHCFSAFFIEKKLWMKKIYFICQFFADKIKANENLGLYYWVSVIYRFYKIILAKKIFIKLIIKIIYFWNKRRTFLYSLSVFYLRYFVREFNLLWKWLNFVKPFNQLFGTSDTMNYFLLNEIKWKNGD